jgi:O-methyltransferase
MVLGRWFRCLVNSYAALRLCELIDRRSENRMTELGIIAQAFEFAKINQVKGDYFEFGIWRGKTFSYAHKMRRRYGLPGVMLRGFDSFQGLPAHEDTTDNIWHKGQFAATEAEVRRLLRKNGIGEREYTLVPGFYSESLNEALDAQLMGVSAAIVYIDCDLYESTARVLAFIKKYLVNGSVVCFDDYYNNRGAPDQGEQRGLQEFLATNRDVRFIPYFDYSPLGKSFIVRLD